MKIYKCCRTLVCIYWEKSTLAFKSPMLSEVGYLFSDAEELSELVTFKDTNVGATSTTAIL